MWGTFYTVLLTFVFVFSIVGKAASEEKDTGANKTPVARSKIIVSKETTRFTEPLREDGYLDCVRLLNEIAGKDVTPENNAVVLLWQAFGPAEVPKERRERYFKLLGMPCPAEKGDYLVSTYDYAESFPAQNVNHALGNRLSDELEEATKKPWSEKDYPQLAAYIAKNEKPLDLIRQAVRRPKFYSPLMTTNDEMLSAIDISLLSPLRDASKLLVARAMLNLRKGREQEAWVDLIACYRLGRLRAQGPLVIDLGVGTAFEGFASDGIVVFAHYRDMKAEQVEKYLDDLRQLPTIIPLAQIESNEWIFQVGTVPDLAAQKPETVNCVVMSKTENMRAVILSMICDPKMDWNEVLRLYQIEWDFGEAAHASSFQEKQKKRETEKAEDDKKRSKLLEKEALEKVLSPEASPQEKAAAFIILNSESTLDFSSLFPATRQKMLYDMTRFALALSVYHGEHGSYPAKLGELTPKYLAEIPKDQFCDKEFHYKPEDGGYLLYSVGKNGVDDGGRNFNEEYETYEEYQRATKEELARDDLAIRKSPTSTKP